MRLQFILLIKEYLKSKPDYHENLAQTKANALATGATEDEFYEALRQFTMPLPATPTSEVVKKKPSDRLKKLVEADIVAHSFVLVVCLIVAGTFYFAPKVTKLEKSNTQVSHINQQIQNLTPQIYASEIPIDANHVFSFPPSNVTLSISGTPKKEDIGFFPYWMVDSYDKVNINSLTAINLFGLEVDEAGNIITANNANIPDPGWIMWNKPALTNLITKARRQRLKVLLTLKSFTDNTIEQLVNSDAAQKTFISNAIQLINTKNLDGINIDFEYTNIPTTKTIAGFTRLITNLHDEIKRQMPKAELTVDTHVTAAATQGLTDVQVIANYVDSMIVMGYDVHTPLGSVGPIAPMGGTGLNIIGLMQSYLEKVPAEKLILGVPYYGYDWQSNNQTAILPYAQLAQITTTNSLNWDETAQSPWYSYADTNKIKHTVYFENTRSLGIKYDYVNKKNLQGVGIWALGYDGLNTDLQQVLVEKFTK